MLGMIKILERYFCLEFDMINWAHFFHVYYLLISMLSGFASESGLVCFLNLLK
jgi:hypothetical protein